MKFPVFDLHCDTAGVLAGLDSDELSKLRSNKAHIDLERAKNLGGYAQCFACFTTTDRSRNPIIAFEKQLAAIQTQ